MEFEYSVMIMDSIFSFVNYYNGDSFKGHFELRTQYKNLSIKDKYNFNEDVLIQFYHLNKSPQVAKLKSVLQL